VNFAAVDEIEDLEHDKGVEDEGEVPRVNVSIVKDVSIVIFTSNRGESSTTHLPSDYLIFPLPVTMIRKLKLGVLRT